MEGYVSLLLAGLLLQLQVACQVPETPGLRFIGCFVDSKIRDLPVLAEKGSMSIAHCYRLCRSKYSGYYYFGVQNANECWCGNSYGSYGSRSTVECNMQCSGDKAAFCGANLRNSIYATGLGGPDTDRMPGVRKLGCFVDSSMRDLPVSISQGPMTVSWCNQLCGSTRFAYSGVQNGTQCWCGNSYGRYGASPITECNTICHGDRSAFCGGVWRNLVYTTGRVDAPKLPGLVSYGCFVDNKNSRDLPEKVGNVRMTVPKCYTLCRHLSYAYFAVQNAKECRCGNSYGRYGIRPITECGMPCSGDSATYCGGKERNLVYSTGVATTTAKTPGMRYIGCFVDSTLSRDLSDLMATGHMSLKKCHSICKNDYIYFGVQHSNECWCGNQYGRYGSRSAAECNMPCSGDKAAFCGANLRNSIYATGLDFSFTPGAQQIGCFVDNGTARDLYLDLTLRGFSTSVRTCYSLSKSRKCPYFGLQNGNECWCGDSYGRYGASPMTECGVPCSGDTSTFCGGAWRNLVYAVGPSVEPKMPDIKSIGCFVDKTVRDLPDRASQHPTTLPSCYKLCRDLNYMYFGMQNSGECRCGNSYGRYGIRPMTECNKYCIGIGAYCGAKWRNNVYATGLTERPIPSFDMRNTLHFQYNF